MQKILISFGLILSMKTLSATELNLARISHHLLEKDKQSVTSSSSSISLALSNGQCSQDIENKSNATSHSSFSRIGEKCGLDQIINSSEMSIEKKEKGHFLKHKHYKSPVKLTEIFKKTAWKTIETTEEQRQNYRKKVLTTTDALNPSETKTISKLIQQHHLTKVISPEELIALRLYTTPTAPKYYQWMNGLLREDIFDKPADIEPQQVLSILSHIHMVTSALNRLQHLKYEGTVYRVINLDANFIKKLQKGEIYYEPAFASTAKKVYDLSRNVLFKIRSKTGTDIHNLSKAPEQEEILFRPGTRFRITSQPIYKGSQLVVEMEELIEENSSIPR